jgi:hypothetical protein
VTRVLVEDAELRPRQAAARPGGQRRARRGLRIDTAARAPQQLLAFRDARATGVCADRTFAARRRRRDRATAPLSAARGGS